MSGVEYILGHSDSEIRRLMLQSSIIRPLTERLLVDAGLAPGMRVLDIGCGVGDVAMLAASIVGPSGLVIGIDREEIAIRAAEQRAANAGLAIQYRQAAVEDRPDLGQFDLVVGRYVLVHQPDPVAFIRAVSSYVTLGGAMAFHEVLIGHDIWQLNPAPLFSRTLELLRAAFASVMKDPYIGSRLVQTFHAAGFDNAVVSCEILAYSNPDSPMFPWIASTLTSLLPFIEKAGLATAADLEVATLERRLQEEAAAEHSQVTFPAQFLSWARKLKSGSA